MKNLSLLLAGLILASPIQTQVKSSEYYASMSIKIQVVIPKEPIIDVYYEGNYKIMRAR